MNARVLCLICFNAFIFFSCHQQQAPDSLEDQIAIELHKIDSLLQNEKFAEEMAMTLNAAYYEGVQQPVTPLLNPGEDSALQDKSILEEKIATNVAGFYALECGLNWLCQTKGSNPSEWLQKIGNETADDSSIAMLERFANATWKAGQPFRGLSRIKKSNFISWSELSNDEVAKDYRQIKNAATLLSQHIKPGNKEAEMNQLKQLLQDSLFATQMAAYLDSMYYVGEQQTVQPFISDADITATKKKSIKEEKIATNLAGFYATECVTNYLVNRDHKTATAILQSLLNGTMNASDVELYARFANATWKAGQPFRSLQRITRQTFTPFYFLSKEDIDKDLVQVKAAAKKLLEALQ